jgi:DNA-binding CsgD family transcriptional regulator
MENDALLAIAKAIDRLAEAILQRKAPSQLRRSFTPEECAVIQKDYAAGTSIYDMARKLGTSEKPLRYQIRQMGLQRPQKQKALGRQHARINEYTDEDLSLIRQDYAGGVHISEIARKLGRSVVALRTRISQMGLRRRRGRSYGFTAEELNLIRLGRAEGIPVRKIARDLGRAEQTIYAKILEMGLPRNPRANLYTPDEVNLIKQKFAEGLTVREIAEVLGRNIFSIQTKIYGLGLRRGDRRRASSPQDIGTKCAEIDAREDLTRNEKIAAKYAAGATLRVIGEQHGLSTERARQIAIRQQKQDEAARRREAATANIINLPPSQAGLALFCRPVSEVLELSIRSINGLKNDKIVYIGDLVQKTEAEMLRIPNFGRVSLKEVKEALGEIGLRLGMDLPGWPPPDLAA